MRHLCDACVGLKLYANSKPVASRLAIDIYEGVDYLVKSGSGISTGKPCHLCALLLRSLKSHQSIGTEDEESSLPSGPLSICLSDKGGSLSLLLTYNHGVGLPIKLDLGTDESCRGSEVSSSASSDQVFSQIQSWSNDCLGKHSRCSIARSSVSWLPSRVVDLGSFSGPISPKLLETRGAVGRYVTLTHRWTELTGPSSTTLENYESRKGAIDVSSLSLTFQDALEAAHRLGVRYLWIDALCIIQDSAEDWAREASNMRSIYEFAWLNIAVAGSEKSDGRIFMKRTSRLSRACKLPDSLLSEYISDFEGPIHAYLSSRSYAKAVFNGFLTRRGWILQERILSPRTVYFGQEEIFWECSTTTASETIPWGWEEDTIPLVKFNSHDLALNASSLLEAEPVHPSNPYESPRKIRKTQQDLVHQESSSPLYNYWFRLVEAYTRKDLTQVNDRLPAIFGLAQALHKSGMPYQIFSDCYQDGIWLSEPTSLLWYLDSGVRGRGTPGENTSSYSWGGWRDSASFIALEAQFYNENQPLDKELIDSLGGHPGAQTATISLTSTDILSSRPQIPTNKSVLQVTSHVDLATLRITTEKPIRITGQPRDELRYQPCDAEASINILDSEGFIGRDARSLVFLDNYLETELRDWLKFSNNTIWLLKLAVGYQDYQKPVHYISKALGEPGHIDHLLASKHFDFGLIIVPSHEDFLAMKEIQERLEAWNLPAAPAQWNEPWKYGDKVARSTSPPLEDSKKKHMVAQERFETYKLMGPHNTTFRRIGIYRVPISNYRYYKKHEATVLLV
ncbi:heterokaryon incompatibility protein-domain-containing protein [Bisporella sp. PMI_857]|nr:heterokaryon incompatibility protein-domain-containing protein [Bisporella sp. PMI_857]